MGQRVACIDIGTVTVRLAVADVVAGRVVRMAKTSTICNLGEGLGATGRIGDAAQARVLGCVDACLARARQLEARVVCCTLTSAARDAANSNDLLAALAARGLEAAVIPGEVEGSLTFLGVTQDFPDARILVADNGGGSTELALGSMVDGALSIESVRSTDVGCRRITEKFFSADAVSSDANLVAARAFAHDLFEPVLAEQGIGSRRPERLVVTGGTATSLVAIHKALDPYDPAQVHLASLSRDVVSALVRRLSTLTLEERAALPGLQPKRAGVILAGAMAIDELMSQTGFDVLTVSESDLLFGLAICAGCVAAGEVTPFGWGPRLSRLAPAA